MRMHRLSTTDAELFFEAYKGVWEDHSVSRVKLITFLLRTQPNKRIYFLLQAHIKHLTSGPLIAIAIATDVNSFRDFAGPLDPVIVKKLSYMFRFL